MPIVSLSKIEKVRQAILYQILAGQLRPGERLLEARLAQGFGVSQATVNAALQDLHNQGLVTKLLSRSTRVSHYTRAEIEKLFAVRLVLEPAAAAAAAARWSPESHERLSEQVRLMRQAARSRDVAKFCLADYTFHQQVYTLSENSFLIQACEAIAAAPFAYLLCERHQPLPTDYPALAEDHQQMIEAMERGPEEAERRTRERIEQWLSHSVHALEAAGG